MDWAEITANAETALTLDPEAREAFLTGLASQTGRETLDLLLQRATPPAGFLSTSAPGLGDDGEKLDVGTTVGSWRIEEHIGRGGMGDVYRASRADGLYEQTVALKLIQGVGPARAALFDAERRRLALMDHPGIARIIDGGSGTDGRPYMAMEFIDGEPITVTADRGGLPRQARLSLFRAVCDAVGHAHGKLILHRDIKAENVLVDREGYPRLIDFGISSDLGEAAGAGGPLTLATAAPEQLKGEAVSVQTDIFALGVLLHELLTGTRPKRRSDGGMQVDAGALASSDLSAILAKALETDPACRYNSVASLGEDLAAVMEHRPVRARRGGWSDAATKFLQRYPLASALGAAVLASLIAGLTASLGFAADARAEAARAEIALERANWQFGRTEASLAAQQAYSDVLQRTFGGGEDVERLSTLMQERWEEAFAAREADPKTAAALSYAVGRNFYFRGDTARALAVFDPWMAEKFGPTALVDLGEEVYAMMLSDAGRFDEATVIFRRLVDFYGDGSRTSDGDASNYAYRLASITRDTEDIEFAKALLEARLERLEDPFERLFNYSHLARLQGLQGEFDGAVQSFSRTVEIFEANPGYASYGRDISRFNLASITLGWRRDPDAADALVEQIFAEDVPLKGDSVQTARALMLRAIIQSERSRHEDALATMNEAVDMFARFGGENSGLHLASRGVAAGLLARSGDHEAAGLAMDAALTDLEASGASQRAALQLRLMQAYLDMLAGGADPSENGWLAGDDVRDEVSANYIFLHFYRPLAANGFAPEFWER